MTTKKTVTAKTHGSGTGPPLKLNPALKKRKLKGETPADASAKPVALNPELLAQSKLGPGVHEIKVVVPQPPAYSRWLENIAANLLSAFLGWALGVYLMTAPVPPTASEQPSRDIQICAPLKTRDAGLLLPPFGYAWYQGVALDSTQPASTDCAPMKAPIWW